MDSTLSEEKSSESDSTEDRNKTSRPILLSEIPKEYQIPIETIEKSLSVIRGHLIMAYSDIIPDNCSDIREYMNNITKHDTSAEEFSKLFEGKTIIEGCEETTKHWWDLHLSKSLIYEALKRNEFPESSVLQNLAKTMNLIGMPESIDKKLIKNFYRVCASCYKKSPVMLICGRCKSARYCSKKCQK